LRSNGSGLHRRYLQYLQAIPIAQRALAITEKALGPEHADSATALNNLALWLCLLRKRLGSRAQAKLMPSRPPQKFVDVVGAQRK
jgi:tetratricopeptide repeat protein